MLAGNLCSRACSRALMCILVSGMCCRGCRQVRLMWLWAFDLSHTLACIALLLPCDAALTSLRCVVGKTCMSHLCLGCAMCVRSGLGLLVSVSATHCMVPAPVAEQGECLAGWRRATTCCELCWRRGGAMERVVPAL